MAQFGFPQPQQPNNVSEGNFKRADAFINIAVPLADGVTAKIDRGLRIYFDGPNGANQKALVELLQTDEGIERFRKAIVITCNLANAEKAGYAL